MNQNLLTILNKLLTNDDMKIFHKSAEKILTFSSQYTQVNDHNKENKKPGVNQIRLFDNYYRFNDLEANILMADYSKKDGSFIKKENILRKAIDDIAYILSSSKDRKIGTAFYKHFFELPYAKTFLHDYLHHFAVTSSKSDFKLKVTSFCINIADAINKFVITRSSFLKEVFSCCEFSSQYALSEVTKNKIVDFITLIFSDNNTLISEYFIKENIVNKSNNNEVTVIILRYFRLYFIKEYKKNTIYLNKIKDIILQSKFLDNADTFIHENNVAEVKLGYYLLELLCDYNIVDIGNVKPSTKKLQNYYLEFKKDVLNDLFLRKSHQIPYLNVNQLSITHGNLKNPNNYEQIIKNNLNDIIHENTKINLSILETSYIHENKLYTKLSVDLNYLSLFLNMLNDGLNEDEYLSLYDIDLNQIQHLRSLPSYLKNILEIVLAEASNFENIITPTQLKKYIDEKAHTSKKVLFTHINLSCYKNDKELLERDYNLSNLIWDEYKDNIYTISNKICSRKLQLIAVLIECIENCIFKYFINTTFMDSRGRAYLSAAASNILTNPVAKMIIKLYDDNEGSEPSLEDFHIMKKIFKFEQTKQKMASLIQTSDHTKKNILCIFDYINTYLNMDANELKMLIRDPEYDDNSLLLSSIKSKIKKMKKLFYVHSLIIYERLRYKKEHDNTIFNYIQKDASSSGFQVMSAFFRDPKLATLSNLIGKEDYNIYLKGTEACYNNYLDVLNFTQEHLKIFESSDFLTYEQDISFTAYTTNDFTLAGNNITLLLKMLITVDFDHSSISRSLLHKLACEVIKNQEIINIKQCEKFLEYLSEANKNLIYNFSTLMEFKNLKNILEYLFVLRFAVRLVIIAEQIIKIPHEKPSLWFDRDLTKNHIMTTLYRSTTYGRKDAYIKLIREKYLLSKQASYVILEFASFLEKCTSFFLTAEANIDFFYAFTDEICTRPVTITNRNFRVTLNPKITTDEQIPCSSFSGKKRPPQLVIKKMTSQFDQDRMKTMFLANLAHMLDSDLMHHFTEICLEINFYLNEAKSKYRIIFERNHDCFILNYGPLLSIFVEEAYLRFCSQNNINYVENISPEIVKKYVRLSVKDFMEQINPINPYFIK